MERRYCTLKIFEICPKLLGPKRVMPVVLACIWPWATIGLLSHRASASSTFFEFGGGLSKVSKSSTFYDGQSQSNEGSAAEVALAFRLSRTAIPFYFGINHRWSLGNTGAGAVGLEATYPYIQFKIARFFFGVGATSLVWKKSPIGPNRGKFCRATGDYASEGTLGYEMPITPEISFNLSATAQYVKNGSNGNSPAPALDGIAAFRLFFGFGSGSSSGGGGGGGDDTGDSNYRGYRYPFGNAL